MYYAIYDISMKREVLPELRRSFVFSKLHSSYRIRDLHNLRNTNIISFNAIICHSCDRAKYAAKTNCKKIQAPGSFS
jgi:hypothetical protein